MSKTSKAIVIALAGVASFYGLGAAAVSAQGYIGKAEQRRPDGLYDNGSRAEPYGYSACHTKVRATGIGYPFGIGSKRSAIKAWEREAWSYYGHDFAWSRAEEPYIECAPYLATIRCTATARPCS
jgi:hypothetical protein